MMLRNFRFSISTCIRNSGILNYRSEIINRTLLVKSPPRAWLSTSQQLKQKNLVSYGEIETFSFSTKEKQFKIYVRDIDTGAGSSFLKISEIWNGGQSNVYVNKSALKTFISSIEMVAKQKERVTFPNMIMEKYDNGRRKIIMEYLGDRKGSYAIKILERKDGKKDSKIILPEEGITDMIGFLVPIDIDNGTDYREIETFSFSTKKEEFKIYVREDNRGSLHLKISEISNNGRQSSVYVEKSVLKTFISSIEMVAKQKRCVSFSSGSSNYDKNISMEYYGGRSYWAINIYDRGDGREDSMITIPAGGISNMIRCCKDILNGIKEHQSS